MTKREFLQKQEDFKIWKIEDNFGRFQAVIKQLDVLREFFSLEVKEIENDAQANALFTQLLEFPPFGRKKPKPCGLHGTDGFDDAYIPYLLKNEFDARPYMPSAKGTSISRFLFLAAMQQLINDKTCYGEKGMSDCEKEIFSGFLCPDCLLKYKARSLPLGKDGNLTDMDYLCHQCREKAVRYLSQKQNGCFCGRCLENRIIRVYNNLHNYMAGWNFSSLPGRKRRYGQYREFLNAAVSVLYYEKGRVFDGYGCFKSFRGFYRMERSGGKSFIDKKI